MLRPITEVAADLGVSRDTLERRIADGELASYRKDGDRRTWVDVEEARAAIGFRRIGGPKSAGPRRVKRNPPPAD